MFAASQFETVRQAGAHTAHTCTAQAFKRLRRHDLDQIAVPIEIYFEANWEAPKMFARPNQINAEIADVERLISSKNQTILSALEKGTDTHDAEKQVAVLNKALQLKKGARRKLIYELRIFEGASLA